ncbi:Tyrosine phosphatase family protein [Micromonospora phaseoli]|uniref:Tyrosine phosphatase family protein n=1 Tax=Micromonospora phaseoli TaxID=1144548 RepID=A0A1H6RIQ1_9ACTN|nr:tyrosine-protein phosphatase [Micromonospora phaseoli]PZW03469.1 tyrosine phosphatase family protein [Micromonospora phaseoli]GIJ77036.1 hypothetical protein Xph01_14680 [Micromonospora phaseoli]SEI54356.1 Tyrosine phosphatase family protein [Micromonospora phaseoli]
MRAAREAYVILDWPGCRNGRDLGGLPTMDGGRTRYGALLRSGGHDGLDPSVLRDAGIGRVVDLRWARECVERPSPFAGTPVYRHAPMLNDVLDYEPPDDSYGPMLDHNRVRIANAFRVVAEAPTGGVLVHCHAGRDRTGVLVALLLQVAGVGADEIADDYARTDGCTATPMQNTLAHLERRYGGAVAYLVGAGVEPALVAAVRTKVSTSVPPYQSVRRPT